MGHSSGAAAVSLLSLSPKTTGLFHRVIMMSGSSGTRAFDNRLDFYWTLAEELKCAQSWQRDLPGGHAQVMKCMRQISQDCLGKTYLRLQGKVRKFNTDIKL